MPTNHHHPTLSNIQLLRAVAVLLVVLFHIEPYLLKLNDGYVRWIDRFGYSGVDLFFVISGFINSHVSMGKMGTPAYSLRFILKRLIRIVPNYWLILLPTAYLVYEHGLRETETVSVLWSFILLVPQHLTDHIMIPAWTLNYELFFYLALAGLMLVPRWILPVSAVFFVVVAIVQYWFDYSNVVFAWAFALSPYWLQFIAGLWIGFAAHKTTMPLARCAILFALVMFGITIYINSVIYPEGFANPFHRDLRAWLYLLAYAPLVYGLVALEIQSRWQCQNRLLIMLGDASYSLYLWMTAGLFVLHQGITWAWPEIGWPIHAALSLSLLIAFVLGYYRLVEQPMLRWFNARLLGR